MCWDCHFGIHHPISRHSWCKIYSARLARLIFREGFPDSSPTLIGESLRPPEAADPECQLRLNSTLKLIETMANRHFANNNGNVAHLDPIGSAAYDINIPGSDYDFVLRFKNSAVLEGDSLLLGDWRGDDHDGLGHPKKGYTISQNMSNQTKTNPFGTGGNQEILRPLNFETSKCECTNQQQSDGIASWDGKRDSGIQGSSGWLMTYSFLGEISVRSSRGILGNILNHLETSPH